MYVPLNVKAPALKQALDGLRVLHVKGFNVTAPHKVKVIEFLDRIDGTAAEIGSVNTVVSREGKLLGYNTDGIGALKCLEEAGTPVDQKNVLLIGAGGAARAIAYALAPKVRALKIANRTIAKAKLLQSRLRRKFNLEAQIGRPSTKTLKKFSSEVDIIVNASSMGVYGKHDPLIKASWIREDQSVLDLVYEPVETKLLRSAALAGANSITGLDMLVSQGAYSFELWTGRKAPVVSMRHAVAQRLLVMAHAENS